MPASFYGNGFVSIYNREIDFDTDTIKMMLVTEDYAPNQATDRYKSAIVDEVSGGSYVAGGNALSATAITWDDGLATFTLDADDLTFLDGNYSFRYGIVYDDTPALDTAKPLIMYFDFGAQTATSVDVVVAFSGSGMGAIRIA